MIQVGFLPEVPVISLSVIDGQFMYTHTYIRNVIDNLHTMQLEWAHGWCRATECVSWSNTWRKHREQVLKLLTPIMWVFSCTETKTKGLSKSLNQSSLVLDSANTGLTEIPLDETNQYLSIPSRPESDQSKRRSKETGGGETLVCSYFTGGYIHNLDVYYRHTYR